MKLSKEQFVQLRSAGFTERQITTMQEKFYILLNTAELPEPVHLRNIMVLEQQVTLLRDAMNRIAFSRVGQCESLTQELFNREMWAAEALAATADLSGSTICHAKPIWVKEDVAVGQEIDGRPRKIWWECNKGVGEPFYRKETK